MRKILLAFKELKRDDNCKKFINARNFALMIWNLYIFYSVSAPLNIATFFVLCRARELVVILEKKMLSTCLANCDIVGLEKYFCGEIFFYKKILKI